jgi:ATP-binding cassette subfamily F protein 3
MIALNNISVSFSGKDLFDNISFQINPQDKIGLTGKNGAGKSTLLKIIIGEMSQYSGNVSMPKDIKIGYLPQHLHYSNKRSVFDEAFTAFDEYKKLSKQLEHLNNQLIKRTDYQSKSYHELIDKITELSDILSFHNENSFIADTERILKGLGFDAEDFSRPTSEFSGGWRMRIEIAKILLKNPDVLLLDEPTNHLDIESIQWLEDFLKNFKGAIVLISHDRRFLDNVTNRTIEISLGKIYDYPVPYSKYKQLSKERKEQQLAAFNNQQNKIKQTEKFIEKFRSKATKASQVQSRIKMLEKIDKINLEPEDNAKINFRFPSAPRAGDIVVETRNLTKKFDEKIILENIDFTLERGEKIAFVGKNGEGKTTFVRIINQELDFEGHLKIGHNVSVGYYAQNQDQTLDKQKTVFDTLNDIAVGDIRTQLRKILGAFLFRDSDIDKKVAVLSGGERARLALAKLILQPYSLLILDEPTNHLDIAAKDILKQALSEYNGTLIVVSHDRDFLNGLTDTIYEFSNKKIKQFKGGIDYFLEKKKLDFVDQLNLNTEKKQKKSEQKNKNSKNDYLKRKEIKRNLDKINKQINSTEKDIEIIEKEINSIEQKLAKPDNLDKELFEKYENLKEQLADKMEIWENLQEQAEKLNNNI